MELVHGAGPECIPDVGPVERDPYGAHVLRTVIGDVLERETGHGLPRLGVENLGNHRTSG